MAACGSRGGGCRCREVRSLLLADCVGQIAEVSFKPSQGNRVLSIAHPAPSTWNTIIKCIGDYMAASGRPVRYVGYDEWLTDLEDVSTEPSAGTTYTALELLDFLRDSRGSRTQPDGREATGAPKLAMDEIRKVSRVIHDMQGLRKEDVERWMKYWETKGMFSDQ